MRKTLLAAACASALSAWAHDDWSLNNHWNVTGDFIYFKRNSLNGKNLVNDSAKIIDLTIEEVVDIVDPDSDNGQTKNLIEWKVKKQTNRNCICNNLMNF